MTAQWNDTEVTYQRVGLDRMTEVLGLLDEVAGWLNARGINQWPGPFQAAWVEDSISRGETWLVAVGDDVAGTVTVNWSDPLWADTEGAAGYVHRIAVHRWAAGRTYWTGQPMPHGSEAPAFCGWTV